ncbi:glycoside hydrolase, partial [Xylariaceae sp. FL1651]
LNPLVVAAAQPDSKRVVQYYGQQISDQGLKFHIAELVNNADNKTCATNVLIGSSGLLKNKTMSINGRDPGQASNDWYWNEIKTVQNAGVKVSLWLRHDFDGIDLDIEDGEGGCTDQSMILNDTVHLVRQLRVDFGPNFLVTLAPVSSALLKKERTLYGGSWTGLKMLAFYEQCVNEGGWKLERIVTTITASSDFTYPLPRSSWLGLNVTGPTIEALVSKYANFGGVGGFDYYDAQPGGYKHPWQWSRWAAR